MIFFAEDCWWLHVFRLLPFAGIQLNTVYKGITGISVMYL